MSFCPECDVLLEFVENSKGVMNTKCPDCDYFEENENAYKNLIISEEIEHSEMEIIEVIDLDQTSGITSDIREELSEMYKESMSSAR